MQWPWCHNCHIQEAAGLTSASNMGRGLCVSKWTQTCRAPHSSPWYQSRLAKSILEKVDEATYSWSPLAGGSHGNPTSHSLKQGPQEVIYSLQTKLLYFGGQSRNTYLVQYTREHSDYTWNMASPHGTVTTVMTVNQQVLDEVQNQVLRIITGAKNPRISEQW